MILQALADYYERRRSADPRSVPEWGFERQPIPFVIVLSQEGTFLNIEDTRDPGEGKNKGRVFTVPEAAKRTSGIRSHLLWDKPDYALGFVPEGKKPSRVAEQHEAFKDKIESVFGEEPADKGVEAVLTFLRQGVFQQIWEHPTWEEVASTTGAYLSFRLSSDTCLVAERPEVVRQVRQAVGDAEAPTAQCLISGEEAPIATLHPAIKGVRGAQSSGANIVSFNLSAFETHGRSQGANAPVSEEAAFAYTTALNTLLSRGSRNKAHVGDTTVVFWAESANPVEDIAAALFRDDDEMLDDPDHGVEHLRAIYSAPWQGNPPLRDEDSSFFILGLAPNASRIAIRFWRVTTVSAFAAAILEHFEDVAVERPPWASQNPSIRSLLLATAVLGREDNIPPNLAGEVLDAIIAGRPYPERLLTAAVQRARAEQKVTPDRAATIKGCLVRGARKSNPAPEVDVGLDERNENIGYRLGRLFAALERVQETASPGVQSGIRERYYSAASATPTAAFPTLMKLKNHHLAKIDNRGAVVNLERLLGSILDGVGDFPAVLSLPDQGRFALGYYHQRQSFFTRSDETEEIHND